MEIHTDKEGKPAGDEKKIYKKLRTFNEKGYLVSQENFRPDNNRRHLENAVAKVVYSHDENGNIISRKNFGEDEEASTKVSDGNGVHEYRYTYQEYFTYDGKPILNECMYHRKEKGILPEPYDCALKIEHFGINGKPIEDKQGVYRTNLYYTGSYQVEADRQYYTLNEKFIASEREVYYTNNPFGNQTLDAKYETKEGKEVLVFKYEYKYDEKNNPTLDAYYETKEGKEVLVSKTESKYDEKNNKTLDAYYETEEGKEVLVSKTESKYDEKNNQTFFAKTIGEDEVLEEKTTVDYRLESYSAAVTQYEPEIKQIQVKLNQTKDESEKKSLNQKLEDLKKEFESKKKKYTLTEEKFGKNEKLESASYKLLFFNPRGPAEKRLMRVDLDRFYRPVKVGFEEE